MTISVVLRLGGSALAEGRLAGEAEIVATGERAVVRDAVELIGFLRRSPEAEPRPPLPDEVGREDGRGA